LPRDVSNAGTWDATRDFRAGDNSKDESILIIIALRARGGGVATTLCGSYFVSAGHALHRAMAIVKAATLIRD
jgi:hypothetical protein